MGNTISKENLNTKNIVTGLSILAVGTLGTVYFLKSGSKKKPQTTKSIAGSKQHDDEHAEQLLRDALNDQDSALLLDDESEAASERQSTSASQRRQTALFDKNELVSTEGWETFEDSSIGLKFKHPKGFKCSKNPQNSLMVVSIQDSNSSTDVARFMTLEFQAEKTDPKEYASKALDSIRQMVPNLNVKTDRKFDFNGNDAYELDYEIDVEGKGSCVWNMSIATDRSNFLFQCMYTSAERSQLDITKTVASTIEFSDIPARGMVKVSTPSKLKIGLPSPHLVIQDLKSENDILKASFGTKEEPILEQFHITQSAELDTIEKLIEDLEKEFGKVNDRGELDLAQVSFKSHLLQWSTEEFEYIGLVFAHDGVGFTIKSQIEESRYTRDFQQRTVSTFDTIEFLDEAPKRISARYEHEKFSIMAPVGTPLREPPAPVMVQFFHAMDEMKPIHTNVEFRVLRNPIHDVETFNEEIKKDYESPEVSHMNEVLSQEIVTVNGKKAVRLEMSSVFAPDPMTMFMQSSTEYLMTVQTSFLVDELNVMTISSIALKKDYEKNSRLFDQMHESFIINEPK